jgi:hypothetical protein
METRTLPRYQSHKHVSALKIQHVTLLPGDGPNDVIAHVGFEDESYPPIHVNLAGKPTPHKGWYYVIYDAIADDQEPYESFSPPEAFEKGYSPVPFHQDQPAVWHHSFTQDEIANWFTYHPPTSEQLKQYGAVRHGGSLFADILNANVPAGADKTAAMRKIREAVMTANAAIACHKPLNATLRDAFGNPGAERT